jgi:hypothetical protein
MDRRYNKWGEDKCAASGSSGDVDVWHLPYIYDISSLFWCVSYLWTSSPLLWKY